MAVVRSIPMVAVLAAANVLAAPCVAQTYRTVTAEAASIDATTHDLSENGRTFKFITKGDYSQVWISPTVAWNGGHSVGFDMLPTSGTAADGSTTDKAQYRVISGSETNALDFLQDRCTGFAVRLETNFQTPDQAVQLFQWWQGSPFSPPLELRVKAGSLSWELVYRNDQTGRGPTAAVSLAEGGMSVGAWYRFVVCTRMSYSSSLGTGNVKLWLNGTQYVDQDGVYGYNPNVDFPYAGSTYRSNPRFDLFFGLYRPRQSKRAKAFFDQVRFGVTYADVNPG